jgi:hypothetical protein
VNGDTIGWDPEREVVVSASAIPSAVEATWAPSPEQPSPSAPASSSASSTPPSTDASSRANLAVGEQAAVPVDAASNAGGGSVRLGWDAGQPTLAAAGAGTIATTKRGLVSGVTVLPEITEAPVAPRRLWRHPAFIVSMITTVIAIGVAVTLIVMAALAGGPPRVTGLDIAVGSGSVALSWNGPNVGYDLYVVGSGGEVADVSQIVRGRDAWIPRAFGYVDDDSCFVVRATGVDGEVSLAADVLEAQGAASVCMADADE